MRRLLRLLKWTFALLLGLPLLAYLALLLINWNDQPPSAEALEMQRILAERPVPADEDNAHVYLLGILAAEGVSPVELGRKRLDWIETAAATQGRNDGKWPEEPLWQTRPEPAAIRPASVQTLIDRCKAVRSGCKPDFASNVQLLGDWLKNEDWLLERYQALIDRDASYLPAEALDIRLSLPPYQHALEGQRLLLVKAWLHADKGEINASRTLLAQDLHFWRMWQASADNLIERMIAVAAIRQHFQWGRTVVDLGGPAVIPENWISSFSHEERSLQRTFAGEWQYSNSILRMIEHDPVGEEQGYGSALLSRLGAPLFQPQDIANRHATALLQIQKLNGAPLNEMRKESTAMREHWERRATRGFPYVDSLYNLPGQMIERLRDDSAWIGYAGRVSDLESIRRASLLLVRAVAEKIPDERMAEYVAGHELIDPYSEEPFGWDAEKGVLLVPLLQQDEPLAMPLR